MRIVVKVGTSTLAYSTGNLNIRHMEGLCKVLSDIKNAGYEVILVSSGAVGMGMGKLALRERPSELSLKQAAAAVGQCELMYTYDKLFSEHNHTVAQILLTAQDINDSERRQNFISTMLRLFGARRAADNQRKRHCGNKRACNRRQRYTGGGRSSKHRRRTFDTAVGHRRSVHRRPAQKAQRDAYFKSGKK